MSEKEKIKEIKEMEHDVKLKLTLEVYKKIKDKEFSIDDKIVKINGRRNGIGSLKNIFWIEAEIENLKSDDKLSLYPFINLMFFKVDKKTKEEAEKIIFPKYIKNKTEGKLIIKGKIYSMSEYEYAHVDGDTGNIHPGTKKVDELSKNYNKISQLVLCSDKPSHPGPNTLDVAEDVYSYGPIVHKACYFPLIVKDDNLKNDPRYEFLKKFASELPEEILSDEILEEIGKK